MTAFSIPRNKASLVMFMFPILKIIFPIGGKRLNNIMTKNIRIMLIKFIFCLSAVHRINAVPKTRACTGKKGTKSNNKKRLMPEPARRYCSSKDDSGLFFVWHSVFLSLTSLSVLGEKSKLPFFTFSYQTEVLANSAAKYPKKIEDTVPSENTGGIIYKADFPNRINKAKRNCKVFERKAPTKLIPTNEITRRGIFLIEYIKRPDENVPIAEKSKI